MKISSSEWTNYNARCLCSNYASNNTSRLKLVYVISIGFDTVICESPLELDSSRMMQPILFRAFMKVPRAQAKFNYHRYQLLMRYRTLQLQQKASLTPEFCLIYLGRFSKWLQAIVLHWHLATPNNWHVHLKVESDSLNQIFFNSIECSWQISLYCNPNCNYIWSDKETYISPRQKPWTGV